MKKVKYTDITSTSAMPFKSGTLEHLQSAYQETTIATIATLVAAYPLSGNGGILWGCKITWVGLDFTITAGAVFVNNEIFYTDATTGTITGANVVVGTITTTYITAANYDPSEFSDATMNNVHEVRKIVWSNAASGSGDGDFDDFETARFGRALQLDYDAAYMTASAGTWTIASAADWDVKITPINGATVMIDFEIKNSTSTALTPYFALQMGSLISYADFHATAYYTISGSQGIAIVLAQTDDGLIYINKSTGGNWAIEVGTLAIKGQILLSVKPTA